MKKPFSTIILLISLLLIAAFSLQSSTGTANMTMKLVNYVARVNNKINRRQIDWSAEYVVLRKLAHTVEYFILGIAAGLFFSDKKHKVAASLLFCAVVSVVDQFSKIVIPGREFDVTDWPFDMTGYVVAALMIYVIRNEWGKRHPGKR